MCVCAVGGVLQCWVQKWWRRFISDWWILGGLIPSKENLEYSFQMVCFGVPGNVSSKPGKRYSRAAPSAEVVQASFRVVWRHSVFSFAIISDEEIISRWCNVSFWRNWSPGRQFRKVWERGPPHMVLFEQLDFKVCLFRQTKAWRSFPRYYFCRRTMNQNQLTFLHPLWYHKFPI